MAWEESGGGGGGGGVSPTFDQIGEGESKGEKKRKRKEKRRKNVGERGRNEKENFPSVLTIEARRSEN